MGTQELYHGTRGDSILGIIRERKIHPSGGQIFFCKQESQMPTLFPHGADTARNAAFVVKLKVHIPDHAKLKPRSTPGVPDTWVLETHHSVKAEVQVLYIRPKPGLPIETVGGIIEINNRLLMMDNRVHPVFMSALQQIIAELKSLNWQPYVDNISRTSAEQAQKVRQGYSKTMRSWHVDTTMATLPHGPTAVDTVHGNAADVVDQRYHWGGAAANSGFQFWKDLGRIAKKHGCEWGGDWKMKDVAHIQMLFIEGAPQRVITV